MMSSIILDWPCFEYGEYAKHNILEYILCPNFKSAPFINGTAPTFNLKLGHPFINGTAPTFNLKLGHPFINGAAPTFNLKLGHPFINGAAPTLNLNFALNTNFEILKYKSNPICEMSF